MNVRPHVARKARFSAIDGRTTRHASYATSQRIRKRIEEAFGWIKTIAGLRKSRFVGRAKTDWAFTFAVAAYNLVRLPKLFVGGGSGLMARKKPPRSRRRSRAAGASPRWISGTIEALDLVEPAFLEIEGEEGEMRFIAVQAWLDIRYDARAGGPLAEFSWEGVDEGDQRSGRGWVAMGTAGRLVGHLYFHIGDDFGLRLRAVVSSSTAC